ncbi:hypothetical protein JCM8097_002399 [Rhodosporidiobolus ruineniae]
MLKTLPPDQPQLSPSPSPSSSRFTRQSSSSSLDSDPTPSPTSTTNSHTPPSHPTKLRDSFSQSAEGERGGEQAAFAARLGGGEPQGALATPPASYTNGNKTPKANSGFAGAGAGENGANEDGDEDDEAVNPLFALSLRAKNGELDPNTIAVQRDGVVVREGRAPLLSHGLGGLGRGRGGAGHDQAGEHGHHLHLFRHHHPPHGANGLSAAGEARHDEGRTLRLDGAGEGPQVDGQAKQVDDFRDHPYEQDRSEQLKMRVKAAKEEVRDRLEEGGWVEPEEEVIRTESVDPKVAAMLERREESAAETDAGASSFYSARPGEDDDATVESLASSSRLSLPSSLPPRTDSPLSYASLSEVPTPPPLSTHPPTVTSSSSPSNSFPTAAASAAAPVPAHVVDRSPVAHAPGFVATNSRLVPLNPPGPSWQSSSPPPRTSSLPSASLAAPSSYARAAPASAIVRPTPSPLHQQHPSTDSTSSSSHSRPRTASQSSRILSPVPLSASPAPSLSPLPSQSSTPPSIRRSNTTDAPSLAAMLVAAPPAALGTGAAGASTSSLAVPSGASVKPRRLSSAGSSNSARKRGSTLSIPHPSYNSQHPHPPPVASTSTAVYPVQHPLSPSPSGLPPPAPHMIDDVDASIAAQAEAIRRQRQEKRAEAEKEAAKAARDAEKEREREQQQRGQRERDRSRERPLSMVSKSGGEGAAGEGGGGRAGGLGLPGPGALLKRRSTRMGSGSSAVLEAAALKAGVVAGPGGAVGGKGKEVDHSVAAGGAAGEGTEGISDDAATATLPPQAAQHVQSGGQHGPTQRSRAAGTEQERGAGAADGGHQDPSGGVLVGNLIGQDHANYVLMYNMLTGIRIGVSRCQAKAKRPLTDADYTARHKFSFDIVGNELTPSVKYDFKFKDYAPWVFRELREYFYLDPSDYLVSLTAKYILSELGSPGKSGSFFYFSRDYRFIIKTIRHSEHKFLRSILKDYVAHIKANPHTLLSRFYGLHRVKLPRGKKIHFIIFNNLFPPHRDIHETYDLKGSSIGRLYPEEKAAQNPHAILKDLNWVFRHRQLALGPEKKALFEEQLRRDTEFLQKFGIMDYSLLTGIHNGVKGNSEGLREDKLSVFQPATVKVSRKPTQVKRDADASALRKAVQRSDPRALGDVSELPEHDNSERRLFLFYQDEGGMRATGDSNEDLGVIYYLGIIDILTPYTLVKRLEHFFRGMKHNKHQISAVPPKEYGDRFLAFIKSSIRGNDESIRPSGFENVGALAQAEAGQQGVPPPNVGTEEDEKAQQRRQDEAVEPGADGGRFKAE